MRVAGNALALEFTEETLDLLYCYSKGIPRLINIFCDFILLSAFADESRTVTAAMVQEVIGELDLENHFWGTSAAVTSPPPVSAAQPAAQAHPLFKEMTDRLDAVERNLSQMVPSALQTVCDSIAALKGELSAQQSRHDAQVTDLCRKMVDLSPGKHSYSVITPSQCRTVPPGFARRLLNSISGKK